MTSPTHSNERRTAAALLVGAVFALASSGSAEPLVLGRADVLRLAAAQNPQVAAARAASAKARAVLGQAEQADYPTTTLTVGVGPSLSARLVPGTAVQSTQNAYSDVSIDDLSVTVLGRLTVIQPLYTFGKIGYRQDAAAAGVAAAVAQEEMSRADVAYEAARLYETYLFARDAATFMDEIQYTITKSLEVAQKQLEAGADDVSEHDILRFESARSLAQLGESRAVAGIAQADAGLRAYLGLSDDAAWVPHAAHLEPQERAVGAVVDWIGRALSQRAELSALEHGVQAYTSLADAEHAGYWPDFFALVDLSAAYTPGRDLVDTRFVVDPLYHFVPTFAVGVRWSLQAAMAGRRADEARAEAARLEQLRQWALLGVPAQVRVAYEDVRRAQGDLEVAAESVARAKKWVVQASADYGAGFTDSRSLTDAVQMYVQLRLSAMDAALRLNIGLAELGRASGTLLSDSGGATGSPGAEIGSEPHEP
jgi:outer membrane protein TolC